MTKAVFLDKDGTLIENVPYNVNPEKMKLCAGAVLGLQLLQANDYKLLVITNQSGIARGYFPETALETVERRLRELLSPFSISLDGFYYCPHHPEGVIPAYTVDCECRKPQPGLLQKAAIEHNLNLAQSWFIGDILQDVAAGRSAGCRTILIDNGNETEWQLSLSSLPHHIVSDLAEAAQIITTIGRERKRGRGEERRRG